MGVADGEALEEEWPLLKGLLGREWQGLAFQEALRRISVQFQDVLPNWTKLAIIAQVMAASSAGA